MKDINSLSGDYLEALYHRYQHDPSSVAADWRQWFDNLPAQAKGPSDGSSTNGAGSGGSDALLLQERVDRLVRAYRVRGHLIARIDPLEVARAPHPELDPQFYGLSKADMQREISTRAIGKGDIRNVGELLERLHRTYCRYIGVQFMHIDQLNVQRWLQTRMESTGNELQLDQLEQRRILTKLTDAVIFEEFLQKKYLGAKSFSLEGAESLLPLLDLAINKAAGQGTEEIVMAMAHRGRLNILANILGKSPRNIFQEFEDPGSKQDIGGGDVKYHLGFSSDWQTPSGKRVHLTLCFNPSHLEFVTPVALGRVRAKQDRAQDNDRRQVMGLIIHGDAAFAGEGVVQESLALSQLPAFATGGTVHVIVNNQIGFTTPPEEAHSSTYATDVGKLLQSPIFHVNGEHPEAVAQVVQLALDFRREFQRDVFIDMYCYRRQGHNEGDEPAFTQPILYRHINKRPSTRKNYLRHLLKLGGIGEDEAEKIAVARHHLLDKELSLAKGGEGLADSPNWLKGVWFGYLGGSHRHAEKVATGVPKERLQSILRRLAEVPQGFSPHPKIAKGLERRRRMADGSPAIDWSTAEALALASLAQEGTRIRLTGQDSARGTFSQRHAVLHDIQTGDKYMPLLHVDENQANVEIYNSPLSETGVLGFEYGHSLDSPDALNIWEAQFGDFINAAQVIVDQFICSAEDKWHRLSGLVLLLPHGFEGQGPEHSSARLERFLTLAAEDNIQVVNCTTAAQYFHVLRRQALRPWRKPLVIFTPKSLLRLPRAASALHAFCSGQFLSVLTEGGNGDDGDTSRVLLCSGKIYYELSSAALEQSREDVAIIRIEELYPFPNEALRAALAPFKAGTEVLWVQEEPENMGAWPFMRYRFGDHMYGRFPLGVIARAASASPATGSAQNHKFEQQQIVAAAFGTAAQDGVIRRHYERGWSWP